MTVGDKYNLLDSNFYLRGSIIYTISLPFLTIKALPTDVVIAKSQGGHGDWEGGRGSQGLVPIVMPLTRLLHHVFKYRVGIKKMATKLPLHSCQTTEFYCRHRGRKLHSRPVCSSAARRSAPRCGTGCHCTPCTTTYPTWSDGCSRRDGPLADTDTRPFVASKSSLWSSQTFT